MVIATVVALSACSSKKETFNESTIDARADSIVGIKMEELNKQSMEDLDQRMAIEVKAKADSIVAARTGKIDTTKKPQKTTSKQIMPSRFFHKK